MKTYLVTHLHSSSQTPFNSAEALFGVYLLFVHQVEKGLALIVFGYFLQYLGHRAQGNEVGEITLIKAIWRKLAKRSNNVEH